MPPSISRPKSIGPHYWFFLHTLAIMYPHHPSAVFNNYKF